MAGIRIDALPQTVNQARDHEFPAMRSGLTVKLTVAQVLSLIEKGDIAGLLAALDIPFDPGTAGPLTETDVQAAIDELVAASLLKAGNLSGIADAEAARDNINATGNLFKTTVHTSSGTHNFTVDTRACRVRVWGAGGGGRSIDNNDPRCGPGGGAGGYSEKFIIGFLSSATITIGAGGTSANAGGNSSYADGTDTLTANGGGSGAQVTGSGLASGGIGGTASGGDLNITGESGEETVGTILVRSGDGGRAPMLLGNPGRGHLRAAAGNAASGFGCGGGGANSGGSAGTRGGGTGGNGLIIIDEYR